MIQSERHRPHKSPPPHEKSMLGRSKYQRSGTRGSCPLEHGPLPADTVTRLPTHSLQHKGDDVWASDTEIETAAWFVVTRALKYT